MATDKLEIFNLALTRLGQNRLDPGEVNDDSRKLDAIYPQVLQELTAQGPLLGWKFATITIAVNVDSKAITAFADYSGTETGTVSCTAAEHGLVSGERANITGTTNYNHDYVITRIDDDTFYFTETFVADDATGTVKWTSFDRFYRFPTPANLRLVKAEVAGFELTDWLEQGEFILTTLEDTTIDVMYVQSITDTTKFPPYFTTVLKLSLAIEIAYSIIQSATFMERLINELERIALPRAIARDEKGQYVKEFSSSWVNAQRLGVIE